MKPQSFGDSTVAQLKNDIDSGRTGDKVSTADPGLSPLGTDDEAAGLPPSKERIGMARRHEAAIGAAAAAESPPSAAGKIGPILVMVGVVVVVILAAVVFVLVKR